MDKFKKQFSHKEKVLHYQKVYNERSDNNKSISELGKDTKYRYAAGFLSADHDYKKAKSQKRLSSFLSFIDSFKSADSANIDRSQNAHGQGYINGIKSARKSEKVKRK